MAKKAAAKTTKKAVPKATKAAKATKTAAKKVAKPATTKKAVPKKAASAKPAKAAKSYGVGEGSKSPQIAGSATSGVNFKGSELSKKVVVLYFYPKDNTPGCTLEGQDFRRLYKQFQAAGAEIVGVSQDSISSHEKFKSKCDFPFELLSDESGELSKAFDVVQLKNMYGREFMGIERSTFIIKNGEIKKEWRKVKVNGHAQEVLDAVKGL